MLSSRGIAALSRNQICRNEHASPHDGQITPPLRGSRRSRARPLSARPASAVPELVEGLATADVVGGFQRYTVRKGYDLL